MVSQDAVDGNQFVFIKGRQILDCILIVNESVEDYKKGNKRVWLTKVKPAEMAIQRRSLPPSPPRCPTTPLSNILHGPCYPPPLNSSPSLNQHLIPKVNRDYKRRAKTFNLDHNARTHSKSIQSSAPVDTDKEGFTTLRSKKMKRRMNRQQQPLPLYIEAKRLVFSQLFNSSNQQQINGRRALFVTGSIRLRTLRNLPIAKECHLRFIPTLLPFGDKRALLFYPSLTDTIRVASRGHVSSAANSIFLHRYHRVVNTIDTKFSQF